MEIKRLRRLYMQGKINKSELEEVERINLKGKEPNYKTMVRRLKKMVESEEQA